MTWRDQLDALDAIIGALPGVAPDAHAAERILQRCRKAFDRRSSKAAKEITPAPAPNSRTASRARASGLPG